MAELIPYIGFIFAAYSIVANDSIQTLGTFLSSNDKRPWWQLWLFTGGILFLILTIGWIQGSGDVSYGRLSKIPEQTITWVYLLPPLALLILTRLGFPVSTTFLVLTFFSPGSLNKMLTKSIFGYIVAFAASYAMVYFITHALEKRFLNNEIKPKQRRYWLTMQALSTGFLWSQWLMHDLANIFVYLPRKLDITHFLLAVVLMLALQAFIFATKGGKIQRIVTNKTNTSEIRTATMIDFVYALVLFIFKEVSKIPMSTTWVFLGVLAGREIALTVRLRHESMKTATKYIATDLGKAAIGLIVSVILAFTLPHIG